MYSRYKERTKSIYAMPKNRRIKITIIIIIIISMSSLHVIESSFDSVIKVIEDLGYIFLLVLCAYLYLSQSSSI